MKFNMFRYEKPSSMLFGLASVMGLIFTTVYTLFSIKSGNFDLSATSIIVSLGIVNGLLAVICVILSRDGNGLLEGALSSHISNMEMKSQIGDLTSNLKKEGAKFEEVSFHLHNIHDQLRDRIVELDSFHNALLIDTEYVPEESDVIDILRISKQFYIYLANNIKDIFDLITGDICSVCIKIIGSNEKDEVVISTLMRDTRSFRERKSKDSLFNEPFLWYENTAFKLILSNDTADTYYASDNLNLEQSYINANNNWANFYNATLVAPIRINLDDSRYEKDLYSNVIGFVCVDNQIGRFNNRASIETMASIVDSLYQYFNLAANATKLATDRIRESKSKSRKLTASK